MPWNRIRLAMLAGVIGAVAPALVSAVDFETVPGLASPVDEMQISSHYWFSDGVRFRLEEGGHPFLASPGAPTTAFNAPGGADTPAAGSGTGSFFLTNSRAIGGSATTLLIEFAGPVQTASGVVLDIDAGDVWHVEAWGGGMLLESQVHQDGDPDAGDGLATPWAFARSSADIDFVRLEHTAGSAVGGGWDNIEFSPVTLPPPPSAALIDFETIPGLGTPSDRLEISNQYQASHGVVFLLEDGTFPEIAMPGLPETAFAGPPNNGGSDNPVASPDQGIGTAFLTDNGTVGGLDPPPLIVEYAPPTAEASGVVLDIDFDESFTIEARDALGTVLETVVIQAGDPDTGDGVATSWSIERATTDIHSIRFVGMRTDPGGFGLGFDLFDTRRAAPAVPLASPLGWLLLAIGLTTVAARGRRP